MRMLLKMSKRIFLFENEEQVNANISRINKNDVAVALTPFAQYELEKLGIVHKIIEDYFDIEKAYQIGIENYQKTVELCKSLDIHLHNLYPSIKEEKINPASFSFYYIKMVYDALVLRSFHLLNLIENEKPDEIFICKTKDYGFGDDDASPFLLFNNR